ncbi:MAG TPA: rRNA maturation RNase YbeY [Terriglobia bacterium]|nr:rRNA maturation RNase YbeY [Terriglobia bacterium]
MLFNRQNTIRVRVRILREFFQTLRRQLRVGGRRFDVTLVDDAEIKRLNAAFRGKRGPTDVLSFPWDGSPQAVSGSALHSRELSGFLGDIVISVETARRNARREGHNLHVEIQQLMLHGLLHLRGYDHETDDGKMNALELRLRRQLGIEG